MQPPFDDAIKVHRWFAVECNNAAWDSIEGKSRSPEEMDRMITVAHAARWHWKHAGGAVNEQRALCLLAYAYLTAGNCQEALHYAQGCFALTEAAPAGLTDFDRAVAFDAYAKAASRSGDSATAGPLQEKARQIAESLPDMDDRETALRIMATIQ
ncbi:MAG: hypothetical protein AMXMBFR84_19480 [Candidatus Hydrogenedentota bacterium]